MKLLKEMGYDKIKGENVKLIDPENTYTINTIMEKVSRSFTHFRKAAGIETPFTLKTPQKNIPYIGISYHGEWHQIIVISHFNEGIRKPLHQSTFIKRRRRKINEY